MSKLIDLVINGGILGNVGIGGGHISFRLIIIIIGDKIFHCVLRKKFFKLPIQLGRQGLVMGDHQGRLIQLLDHIGHGKGLTGPGNSKQGLTLIAFLKTSHQVCNSLRLISGRFILRM